MKTLISSFILVSSLTNAPAQDFGDAPHCYPVLLAQNGARHAASGLRLGPNKSNEADGRPNGISQHPVEEPTDDGVRLPSPLRAGQIETVDVSVSANGRLDAWVDWNHDGDWDDPGEKILDARAASAGANSFNFDVPSALIEGDSVARFRLSLAGGLAPTGIAAEGEVEDYPVKMAALNPPPSGLVGIPPDALSFSIVGTPGALDAVWTFQWQGDPAYSSAISHSFDLETWRSLTHPVGTPATAGLQTLVVLPTRAAHLTGERGFYRLSRRTIDPASPIPCFPGLHRRLLFVSGGLQRTYNLFIPPAYQPGTALPLVLVLHGSGQTADSFLNNRNGELTAAAASRDMIVCLPDATQGTGKTGWANQDDDANPTTPGVDDVAFLDDLYNALQTSLGTHPTRKYIAGFSDGGVMSAFMTARSTHVFSAVASCGSGIGSAAALGEPLMINPPVIQPLPVLSINLVDDGARLFLGQPDTAERPQSSVAQIPEYWVVQNSVGLAPVQANGLPALAPIQTQVNFLRGVNPPGFGEFEVVEPDPIVRAAYPHTKVGNTVTETTITTATWQDPIGDTTNEVILVVLSDGGHQWPDAASRLGFDANNAIFSFFDRH